MLQVYSINQAVSANGVVPFNNVVIDKGCAENLSGVGTIELNKSGVYKVTVDGVASTATTLQLFKNGVALPQAQSTGTTLAFTTFVQVVNNNCNCNICSSPVTLQVKNTTETTLTNVNITVDKLA